MKDFTATFSFLSSAVPSISISVFSQSPYSLFTPLALSHIYISTSRSFSLFLFTFFFHSVSPLAFKFQRLPSSHILFSYSLSYSYSTFPFLPFVSFHSFTHFPSVFSSHALFISLSTVFFFSTFSPSFHPHRPLSHLHSCPFVSSRSSSHLPPFILQFSCSFHILSTSMLFFTSFHPFDISLPVLLSRA